MLAQQHPLEASQIGNASVSHFSELAGWHGGLQVSGNYRTQFVGFEGRPQNSSINVDAYAHKLRSSFAINAISKSIGLTTQEQYQISVTPRIRLNKTFIITPSFRYSYNLFRIGASNSSAPFYVDPTIPTSSYTSSANGFSLGSGLFFNKWFMALNYAHKMTFDSAEDIEGLLQNGGLAWKTTFDIQSRFHAYVGRQIDFEKFSLYPTIYVNTDLSSTQINLNLNAQYRWLYVGIGYQATDAFNTAIGFEIFKKYRFSYSYDIRTSRLAQGSSGAHDFGLRVLLFSREEHRIIKNLPIL